MHYTKHAGKLFLFVQSGRMVKMYSSKSHGFLVCFLGFCSLSLVLFLLLLACCLDRSGGRRQAERGRSKKKLCLEFPKPGSLQTLRAHRCSVFCSSAMRIPDQSRLRVAFLLAVMRFVSKSNSKRWPRLADFLSDALIDFCINL